LTPPFISPAAVLDEFQPGRVIYLPGASGELRGLQSLLANDPGRLQDVTLVSCLLPGMNAFDYAALDASCCLETFLLPAGLRSSFVEGRVLIFPLNYSAIAAYLAARAVDVAFLHLTSPVGQGCTFGVVADFGPIVAASARRRIGIVNRAMPRPVRSPTIPLEGLDAIVEIDEPLPTASAEPTTPELRAIAGQVAALVPDGATLQTGIGQAPAAIWEALRSHRGLRLWSGVVTDGFLDALDAGAMVTSQHVAGIAHGSARLYERFHKRSAVAFADVRTTHSVARMGSIEHFVAINSALEVDLSGQVNLEWQAGRLISGVGGAPDFNAAARRSPGGRSIIAMPASARGGTVSRLIPRLTVPASLGRTEVDTIVTEFGSASLSGLSIEARAQALIGLAAPAYRADLERAWSAYRATV
jgi:acyl-CoA hydrolase